MPKNYYGEHQERIKRDSGETVVKIPFFNQFYMSKKMRNLSAKYAFEGHDGFRMNTLGDANLESFVGDLFGVYGAIGNLAGLEEAELEAFQETFNHAHCLGRLTGKLFKVETIHGVPVVFPTEELLTNQQISLRD